MNIEYIDIQTEFEQDTKAGLSAKQKQLSSKYFYDHRGSEIFQRIMRMPEYYLTDCELEIFQTQKHAILDAVDPERKGFQLLELGAGDGLKTKILLRYFLDQKTPFKYAPVDISEQAVENLLQDLKAEMPKLNVEGKIGDYFEWINKIDETDYPKKVILFLGSNIGNYPEKDALAFLNNLHKVMESNDLLLIGFDLKKDAQIILDAYNDKAGHTADFNLNLLQRINRELEANFDLNNFYHREEYDAATGTAKSYLISKKKQIVFVPAIDSEFTFDEGEKIFTEMSQKYDDAMLMRMAEKTGFEIVRNFTDKRQFFMNSLWKLKS